MTVTFLLTGLGEARLDDVTLTDPRAARLAAKRRLPVGIELHYGGLVPASF